jgi:hypothetical protein
VKLTIIKIIIWFDLDLYNIKLIRTRLLSLISLLEKLKSLPVYELIEETRFLGEKQSKFGEK